MTSYQQVNTRTHTKHPFNVAINHRITTLSSLSLLVPMPLQRRRSSFLSFTKKIPNYIHTNFYPGHNFRDLDGFILMMSISFHHHISLILDKMTRQLITDNSHHYLSVSTFNFRSAIARTVLSVLQSSSPPSMQTTS